MYVCMYVYVYIYIYIYIYIDATTAVRGARVCIVRGSCACLFCGHSTRIVCMPILRTTFLVNDTNIASLTQSHTAAAKWEAALRATCV